MFRAFLLGCKPEEVAMTTVNLKKFFVFGIENVKGETFHGHKEDTLATSVVSNVVKYYNGIGFSNVVATNCNDAVFIKDCNDRLLAFVTEVCNLKADGSKEYRTAYWAWKEVNRNAEAVAEKAAAAAKASASVTGYPDARFKKFRALKDAQEFMEGGDDE